VVSAEAKRTTFSATWTPGADATAGLRILGVAHPQAALVLTSGQHSLTLGAPVNPQEWPEFVRFLRELRDGADEFMTHLDPRSVCHGD
jgi:hypothetical protein